ncbi:MAG TPA: alpha/beta-hydrolase family protein [Candidatus Angelobacter sp.]|nr:alpha/beta-hydrolase family protein [Candidatus Angelobacter sp.]
MVRPEIVGRGQQVGLVVASAAVPTTFTRSLSERSWMDQGLITGLSTGTHFLLTVIAQDALDAAGSALATALPLPESWTDEQRERAATLLLDVVAVPVGFGLVALVGHRANESTLRALVRQAGWRFGLTGIGATILAASLATTHALDEAVGADGRIERIPLAIPVGLAAELVVENIRQRETPPEHLADPARSSPLLGLAAGAGVVLTLAGLTIGETWVARQLGSVGSRVLPGSEATWRRAGHLVSLGAVAYGTHSLWNTAMHRIESGTTAYDEGMDETASGLWTSPNVSGDPASYVPWETLGREGRRHVVTYVRPEPLLDRPSEVQGVKRPELSIATVMKEPARATPISIFVGLDSAPTATERVELALKEMDRTDAWSRELIMLVSPTGTGYVNYVATACVQYMTKGDVATVTLQYSKRPSPLSLGKIGQAKEQNRLLWLKILERVRRMAPEDRPKIVVFGESLGAHTSQAAFEGWGTLGPQALGIDRALWIGTPEGSAWRHELVGRERPDVDRSLVAVVNDYEQFLALGNDAKEHAHYVLLSHDNDGVTKFGASLTTRRPDWLGPARPRLEEVPGRSPRGIPASMRWRPVTTFFQLLVDMKNAQIPGSYRAWAHDYRPDLPEFIRDVFDLDCTDDQLEAIKLACEQREVFRESIFT